VAVLGADSPTGRASLSLSLIFNKHDVSVLIEDVLPSFPQVTTAVDMDGGCGISMDPAADLGDGGVPAAADLGATIVPTADLCEVPGSSSRAPRPFLPQGPDPTRARCPGAESAQARCAESHMPTLLCGITASYFPFCFFSNPQISALKYQYVIVHVHFSSAGLSNFSHTRC
jgi:hypothetical protein